MHKYYRTKSIEESVEWAKKVQTRKAGFVLWGRQYDTLNDIAKAFGLNTGSLRVRVAGRKTLAETVSEMLEKEAILFHGREYSGIASLAAAYGHDSALISDRLIYGMTLERALSQPIRQVNRPEFAIEYDGKMYASKRQLSREIGISTGCIHEMMVNNASAKRLLGQKSILAHILVKTVDEFRGMNPKEVVSYIEGQPYISTVPVELGLTNISSEKDGQRLVGFNSENEELNEGLVRFDIVFYVWMKDGLSQIIVNVEAQKDDPKGYQILNRAIFYVSRLISSQKERDFENSNYDDIKRVYSIWVCMNMEENTMNHIHLTNDNVLGAYEWKGKLDLLNIVMIGLAEELPGHDERYELHRLLGALLSKELTIDEKLNIIGEEYDILIEESFRKDVSVMCNLSQGIEDKGIEIGEARIIISMHNNGFTAEQIAEVTDKDIKDIEIIIGGKELVTT